MFERILVANRGEIAVRVIRACRDRAITSVLLCAEVDRDSLAARLADEVFVVRSGSGAGERVVAGNGRADASGARGPRETYLDVAGVVDAARKVGAAAVHPGYGFLSENPALASACADAGIVFVGPGPEQIRLLGNKNGARRVMASSGVSCVPGSDGPLRDLDEALREGERIGYPVLLKASMGGGGRGMRRVLTPDRMADAFSSAKSEALSAFGNGDVYMERYIARPRHVEMQVALDRHGAGVYLFERECSVQRRFQKMIEEAPSTALDDETRRRMGEAAVRGAQAIGYENLGTFEFLVDERRNFYFLEVNTRLQVEHPVTEEVTGVDLVGLQLDIAAGLPLPFSQADLACRGWAFEARITCEDPLSNFSPQPGKLHTVNFPQGPGVRVDGCIFPGAVIPPYFDSLMAKLIVHGSTREEARHRMLRALDEFLISGVPTSIPFHAWAFREHAFVAGDLSTHFIEECDWERWAVRLREASADQARLAAVLAALAMSDAPSATATPRTSEEDRSVWQWRMAARDW